MTRRRIEKVGIIAGGGSLPQKLADACKVLDMDVFIVGFDGQTDPDVIESYESQTAKLGQVGKIIKAFKKRDIIDLVMIGSIQRPSFSELIPDLKAAKFIASNGLKAMGDSDLLSALRRFLEDEEFVVHGIQQFMPELLLQEDVLTKRKPSKEDMIDVGRGVEALNEMAKLDIGQSIIVQEGIVLGVEAAEGTSALIKRCADLKRKGRDGALIKLCKPQQDVCLDLPTIGLETIQRVHEAGFGGIVAQAGKTLIVDKEELVSYANEHHLYIVGIDPDTF